MNLQECQSLYLGDNGLDKGYWINGIHDPFLWIQEMQIAFLRRQFNAFTDLQPILMEIDYSVQLSASLVQLSHEASQYFEEMRWESLRHTFYSYYNGQDSKVALINHQGQLYYFKRDLSREAIEKYLAMEQMGIGVRVLWSSFQQNSIVMEAGIVLLDFVKRRMNVPQLTSSLLAQINYIQVTLRRMGVAHCDIKPENLIVTNSPEGVRVHLIDMDDAVAYGEAREIGTFGRNMLRTNDCFGEVVTENTDDLGFQYVKNYIFALERNQ